MIRSLFILLLLNSFIQAAMMNIYHDKAQYLEKRKSTSRVISLPNGYIEDSFTLYSPKATHFLFEKVKESSIYDIWRSYIGKKVFYKGKEVTLRAIDASRALIETAAKKLRSVDVKMLLFPPYTKPLHSNSHITLPKTLVGKKVSYSYLLHGISWKSNYTLTLADENKAQLKAFFTISNATDTPYRLDKTTLIAGKQHTQTPVPLYRAQTKSMTRTVQLQNNTHPAHQYYKYSIAKKLILPPRKKLSLFFIDTTLPIQKHYRSTLANPQWIGSETKIKPYLFISFKAPEVLPQGSIIFYDNSHAYLGDASLQGASKLQKIRLPLGEDLHSLIAQKPLLLQRFKDGYRSTIEYEVANNSDVKRTYELDIPLQEAHTVNITSLQAYKILNANLIRFDVTLQPHTSKKFEATFEQRR